MRYAFYRQRKHRVDDYVYIKKNIVKEYSIMDFKCLFEKVSNYLETRYSDLKMEYSDVRIIIKKVGFKEPIKIDYLPKENEYIVYFATMHTHIAQCDTEQLLYCILDYINVKLAVIEFFKNGVDWFGGDIEPIKLDNLTYESICDEYAGLPIIKISPDLTFKVYAWEKKYCFNGSFKETESGEIKLIKENCES